MSSFQDNFSRKSNDDLNYDDSAFYTFASTFLIVLLIPLVYSFLKQLFASTQVVDPNKLNCLCSKCKQRAEKLRSKKSRAKLNFSLLLKLVLILGLLYVTNLTFDMVAENADKIKTFNPFEELELDESATQEEIKKAFKKQARFWHPDKNKSPEAKAKFILITKAYETLKSETAFKNWKETGNPDGRGYMRLSVALPSFVLDKKNHIPILVLFLIAVCVIFPISVWMWYNSVQSVDENGMPLANGGVYYHFLNENTLPKQIPFILAVSSEFQDLHIKDSDVADLNRVVF